MKRNPKALATVLVLTAAGFALGADLKSGPQVNETLAGPFHPLNITGSNAGKKHCLYCENGSNPVAMVFAREVNEPLAKLIKKLDQATAKNSGNGMGSFVVFCSDDEALEKELKKLAKDQGIEQTVLSIDSPAGPEGYNVAKDADVTVVLYVNTTVKANHTFKKGQLKEKDIDRVVADVSKILPKK